MAASPGGLTATIRRKLHDGMSPDEIVQELVAGGLGQTSAQRFVDRALAEDASAPPLPETSAPVSAPAPPDGLDEFIQTKTAETEAENAKTGQKSLWVASALMCGGIAITGFSYIMAEPGQRFTLMWGPVAFGFFLWGKSVLQGFGNARTFAWFSAIGSIGAPVVLTVVLLGVIAASESPLADEQTIQAQAAKEQATDDAEEELDPEQLLRAFDYADQSGYDKCSFARRLSAYTGEGRDYYAAELSRRIRVEDVRTKICGAKAVMILDRGVGVRLYQDWQQANDQQLKAEATTALASFR
jgi:uncharacterized membrane protein